MLSNVTTLMKLLVLVGQHLRLIGDNGYVHNLAHMLRTICQTNPATFALTGGNPLKCWNVDCRASPTRQSATLESCASGVRRNSVPPSASKSPLEFSLSFSAPNSGMLKLRCTGTPIESSHLNNLLNSICAGTQHPLCSFHENHCKSVRNRCRVFHKQKCRVFDK
jgi:hypothetical protein